MGNWKEVVSNGSGMMASYRNIRGHLIRMLVALLLAIPTVMTVSSPVARADEPAEQFLQALRDRGYFDVAVHYLDGAATSDSVPEAFRKRIAFEKAQLLIESVGAIRNPEKQEARLDQADQLLTQYAQSVSEPLEATEVLKFQSNVRYFRGRNYLNQAKTGKASASRKKELFGLAQKLLGDAVPKFREVQKAQRDQIENFQIDPEDPKSDEKLRGLQASYVDTRIKIPIAMEKFALAFDGDAAKQKAKLIEAGTEFEAVAKLYDQRFVQGRMSKAFGARCFQQAADYTKASELLKEVFSYPDPPKMLVREGLNVGVKTWPNIEPYPAKDVIAAADQAVSLLNRREKTDPGWMRIQLELARAKYERSVALKVDNSSASSNLKREASRLARPIARRRNPHSKLAAEMLSGWGISIEAAGDEPVAVVSTTPATSFDDAKEKSKALIVPLSDQLREVTAAKRKMSKMSDAAAKSDQQLEVERLQAAINQRADQSLQMLSQAVRFSNKETPRAEMNNVRYLQAYCYFAKERYADTAVVGRFLLEKYPTIEWSQQTAGLMVRGYERMYDSTTDDVRETAKRKVIDAASAMMAAWPDSKESAAAAVSAARVAVNDGDFEAAKGFFEQIPASSPTRGQLASRIGRQIWTSRKNAADDQERQEKTQRARDFLAIAAENADPATMNFSDAVANLYYIDACRETGDLDQAISRIDGLMGNLDANPAINESAEFRQSVYNASLNVYLEALRSKPDVQTWIDKSKVVIEKMSAEAVGNPAALKTVGDVFRRVASDLKAQFESLPMNDREAFATSLNSFFAGIGSVAKDGKTRLWAGSTLLGIAESLKLEGFTEKAKELSGEAIALLKSAEKAGFGKDKALERSYQVQLALAQRGSGDYSAAVSSFEKILESSNGLNIQMEAATTLLMWGIDGKDPKALTSSMNGRGDYRDPKTKKMRKRIWGWKALVGYTRGKEKLRGPFKECLYNSVRCRFEYGKIANSSKAIDSALSELNKALKRFEFLRTGGTWKNKFDQLLKDLQAAKGKAKK